MAIKRKSNWYIYVITLLISFALLGLFVGSIWDSLFPDDDTASRSTTSSADFRPSADINYTGILMLSDMKATTPYYYMLMNYQPRNETIVFIPLRDNTKVTYGGNSGSLYEMYDNFGSKAVVGGLEALLGIKLEHYVKFDRLSFIDFVNLGGQVYVNNPSDVVEREPQTVLEKYTIETEDGEEQEVTRSVKRIKETVIFPGGAQYFDGEHLYDYITYNFGRGRDYALAVQGSAAMNMINKNFRGISSAQMQGLTECIISSTETDISFGDYTSVQSVLGYTVENSINPCEYYLPYGEEEGGYFIISESCIKTMLERMGITADILKKMNGEK